MDRLTSMAIFVVAIEQGSLVAAARHMGLSPSMAGKHLSALESRLGVRLVQRTTRRLHLTEAGQDYFSRCQRILEAVDEADRQASDAHDTVRGTLRVSAPVSFGAMHMNHVVSSYLALYPHVDVDVSLTDRFVDLLAEGVDVAIRIGDLPDSSLVARRLAPCHMMFCASPDFFDGGSASAPLETVRHAPRLVFNQARSPGDWTATDPHGHIHHLDGPARMRCNNMQMLLEAVVAGMGIAYGPGFVFAESVANGRLVALLPTCRTAELSINAVFPSRQYLPSKTRRFIEHLAQSVQ